MPEVDLFLADQRRGSAVDVLSADFRRKLTLGSHSLAGELRICALHRVSQHWVSKQEPWKEPWRLSS